MAEIRYTFVGTLPILQSADPQTRNKFIECLGETRVYSPYITLYTYLDAIMVDTVAHIIVIIF